MEPIASSSKDTSTFQSPSCNSKETIIEDKRKDPGGLWICSYCNLQELYDFKGNKPPFAKHLTFSEDCYIMKDPFTSLNKGEILVLGADCSVCKNSVCMDCSLFYAKRFCKLCALKQVEYFPLNLKNKIMNFQKSNEEEV